MGLSNKSNNYRTMNNMKNGVNKSLTSNKMYQKMMLNMNTPNSIKNRPKDKRGLILYSIMTILCIIGALTKVVSVNILYFALIFILIVVYKIYRLKKKDVITDEQQKYYDEIKSEYDEKFGKKKKNNLSKEEKSKLQEQYDEYFKSLEEDDKYVNEYNDYDEDEYDYLENEELDDEE